MIRAAALLGAALAAAACGGKSKPAPVAPSGGGDGGGARAEGGGGDDDPQDGVEVMSTRGSVDPDVVSRALEPEAQVFEACYHDHAGRHGWLGGDIELTWRVGADGAIGDVRLSQSDLGAWSIEKCVLDAARGVSFGKPHGGKPATVSAPLSFSGGSAAVVWSEDQAAQAVGKKLAELARCAKDGGGDPTNVTVTLYVGTRGKVQSVGFASPEGFADAWADCAAGRAMAWALTDPRGKVAKLSMVYNPQAVSSDGDDPNDDGAEGDED